MKIIFLDIDGVVNIMSPSYTTSYFRPDGSVRYMDDLLVQRLNYIILKSDANIVISSSWRHNMNDLKVQLEKSNFKYWDRVQGSTLYDDRYRDEQIFEYITKYNIKKYVVLEDEMDIFYSNDYQLIPLENIVEVDPNNGLTHQDVEKALKILEDKFYE